MRFIFALLLIFAALPAQAGEFTRIYHNGMPANTEKARIASAQPQLPQKGGTPVWTYTTESGITTFTQYSIVSNNDNVSDFLRSGRASSRGFTGVTSSAIDSGLYFNR